jgi:hypothetical protein
MKALSEVHIRFDSDVGGLQFPTGFIRLQAVSADLLSASYTLSTPDAPDEKLAIEMSFRFDEKLSDAEIRQLAHRAAEECLDRLAFQTDISAGPAIHYSDSDNLRELREKKTQAREVTITRTNGTVFVTAHDGIFASAKLGTAKYTRTLIVGAGGEQELQAALAQGNSVNSTFGNIYREILRSRDPVAQFMLLYMLLMSIVGDNQAGVDDWIKLNEPDVGMTSRTRGTRIVEETTYTRLRNEVAHGSERKVPLAEMKREITLNIGRFRQLVKIALSQNA